MKRALLALSCALLCLIALGLWRRDSPATWEFLASHEVAWDELARGAWVLEEIRADDEVPVWLSLVGVLDDLLPRAREDRGVPGTPAVYVFKRPR